jgi:mediator of replication checkpoint protein 1
VEKLFKDINSGMLRRKRGAEFDLSDSDDDAEARQRRKRREFAKMRKALLENENVGKIAEDPKKLAFLRAIEDREDDDNLDFLDRPAEDSFCAGMDTQEGPDLQSQQPTLPGSLPNKRKRPLQESIPDKGNLRPPPAARRTTVTKKPATLAEIRESVSFLIEEPGSINVAPDPSSSASEDEAHHSETRASNPRRRPNPNPIIDRLSLKRAESASTSSSSRLAFHDPSNSTIGGFKVPSLLRRATTSSLSANAADANGISTAAATERAAGGGEKGDFVRRGGTKRSSVNYFSREAEKRGVVEGVERRRKKEREREARKRRSGLGSLGVGAFE